MGIDPSKSSGVTTQTLLIPAGVYITTATVYQTTGTIARLAGLKFVLTGFKTILLGSNGDLVTSQDIPISSDQYFGIFIGCQ